MFHRHHRSRAWRLIAAKLTADAPAERALAREFGERTYGWYQVSNTLADLVADELHAQLAEGRFGAAGTLTASARRGRRIDHRRLLLSLELGTRTLGVVGLESLARPSGHRRGGDLDFRTQSEDRNGGKIMGRRPDPLPLKILKGRSATKDIAGRPIPQAPAFNRGAPDPPGWLNPEARGEWNRIAPELDRLELIKPEDAGILVAYCLAWSRLVSAEAIIQTEGLTATNPQTGRRAVHPAVYVVQAASRDLLRLGSHFGLTPVSEVNLATPAKPDSDDDADPFAGA